MSNPAVTQLCSTGVSGTPFWMDDNIGESIHIHIGDVRVDLTDEEFSAMYSDICTAINEMVSVEGFDCHFINPVYIQDMLWEDLPHLTAVKLDQIRLRDILCPYYGKYIPLPYSRAVKALEGDPKLNNDNRKSHHIGQTSEERLGALYESIRDNGYPFNNEYLVLYGDDNIIQDGQHRAACLWKLYGDISVPVLRLYFDNYIDFDKRTAFQRSKLYYRLRSLLKKLRNAKSVPAKLRSKIKALAYKLSVRNRKRKYFSRHRAEHDLITKIMSER